MNSEVRLSELRYSIIERVSILLRPSFPGRDWKSFADLVGFSTEEIRWLAEERDPVITLIRKWETGGKEFLPPTVSEMANALKELKRNDIVDELEEFAKNMKDNAGRLKGEDPNNGTEVHPVTVHETYDVFISYASDDIEFAKVLLKELEASPNNLRVCIDFKDFLPGCCALEQITEVIESRCRKIIVILSDSYSECEMCEYQAQVALMLSPAAKKRLLIPVVYKPCTIPRLLKLLYRLDYSDESLREYFWPRLLKSLV